MTLPSGVILPVTCSIGACLYPVDADDPGHLSWQQALEPELHSARRGLPGRRRPRRAHDRIGARSSSCSVERRADCRSVTKLKVSKCRRVTPGSDVSYAAAMKRSSAGRATGATLALACSSVVLACTETKTVAAPDGADSGVAPNAAPAVEDPTTIRGKAGPLFGKPATSYAKVNAEKPSWRSASRSSSHR